MVSRLPPALTLLPQITYSILWPNISVPVPGIPRTCSVADSSSLNPRFFGCRMKIGRMCSNGRPECARSTAIRVATGQRGSSFSTYPIKTCQRWISSECQGRGTPRLTVRKEPMQGLQKLFLHSHNGYLGDDCYISCSIYWRLKERHVNKMGKLLAFMELRN